MGGIIQTTEKDFIPWTGGRPLVDWSGLDPTSRMTPKSPNQQRPVSSSAAQKGHIYRQTGITTKKLSRADLDLPHFETRVWRHLCDTGLDTIAYVPNPIGSTEMINVIQEHDRFSVDSVIKLVANQVKKYDDYDIQSDDEATEFLKASLDYDLEKELRDVERPDDVFPVTFMRLIHLIRSTSSERYAKIKLRLQNRKPTMYPGQNLTMMASDMRADAKILETARQYEHSLTQLMLDNFLEAGGSNNEDFRYPLRAVKVRLDAAILAIGYLDREAANQYMASEKLSYRDICDLASEGYRNQSDSARGWPPARGVQDSRTPPKAYGNAAISSIDPATLAHAYALLQTTPGAGGKAKPTDVCLTCGKTGHWARDCPQKKSETSKKSGPKMGARRSMRGAHHGRQSRDRLPPRPEDKWKTVAPAPGQPTTKHHDNKPFHWCAKCVRWTPTHTTATHKGPAKTADSVMPLQANFVFDTPSAWNFGVLTHWTWWSLFRDFIVMTVRTILRSICNRSCWIFFSACLGFSLGKLPDGFWMFAWRLLTSHWSTFLPVIGWLSCLILSIFGPYLLFETPVDFFGRPMIKAWVPIGPIRRKQMIRRHRNQEKSVLRSRQSPSRRSKPTHLGLRQKSAFRPPIDDRHLLPLTTAINSLQNFAASISFERVGREGVGRNRKRQNEESLLLRQNRSNSHQTTLDPSVLTSDTNILPQQKFQGLRNNRISENVIFTASKIVGTMSNIFNYLTKTKIGNYPVIWDSGASLSITPHMDDFDGPLDPTPFGVRIQGIAKGLVIAGVGQVSWSFPDAHGGIRTLKIPAYYVPKANVRLLSTNSLLQAYPTETIQHFPNKLTLSGDKENNTRAIEISVDPRSNLHIGIAHDRNTNMGNAYTTTTSLHNDNLSAAEKELLRWHCRLGHLNGKKIQFLMQSGVLAHSDAARRLQTSASRLTSCPMCAACQYGKQKRTATPGRRISTIREREGALKQDDLFPGQRVSVDHFVCSTKGRLPHTYGKEDPKLQYSGGAIFVDHASGYTYIHHQVSLTTHATIESKEAFEAFCRDHGVVVSEYLSDNGTAFTSAAYREHLLAFSQTTKFAGVGAHHHNGVAERAIQTIMSIARTMMLHSAIHWPNVADSALWPLAVDHAVLLFNLMPNPETGLSPHDLFTKTRWRQSDFQNFHVWGCPVYVLDKTISDGKKLPRWKPRSSRQFYVGMSKKHASSVPMCLNLDTGAITPQFHVVFDEEFATVASNPVELPPFDSDAWHRLFGDSVYQYVLDDDDQSQQDHQPVESIPPPRMESVADAFDRLRPAQPLPTPPPALNTPLPPLNTPSQSVFSPPPPVEFPSTPRNASPPMGPTPARLSPLFEEVTPKVSPLQREKQEATPPVEKSPSLKQREQPISPPKREPTVVRPTRASPRATRTSPPPPTPAPSARPKRVSFAPKRYGFDGTQGRHGYTSYDVTTDEYTYNHITPELQAFLASISSDTGILPEEFQPANYKARAVKDPDTLTFEEAMRSPEKNKWMDVAQTEITGLESKHTWKEVPMSDAKSKIIPGTWVFRVKRSPSGEIRKFKARFCVRGDLEEDNGEDNYASVVAWSTVRLFLVLCFILGWTTGSIDFTNAFVQSVLDSPIWIHIPRGFTSALGPGTCLELGRSLYGLRRSPKLFYDTAVDAFLKLGFVQSKFDPCLLYKPGMLIVMYVDDCGIGAADPKDIDRLVASLRNMGFELTQEGDFSEFLGIKMTKQPDGTIEMNQTGLINKIIKATDMEDCNPNYLPATGPLGSDPDGSPMEEKWSYRSIVGMLLYLSTNTRPDIAFAVSQIARFSAQPKQSHATAVKTLVRYLKRTRNKGMILKPTGTLDLELYVDADFCGLFKHEPDADPNSARSRTGFIVMLSGFPLIWKSQLQASMACSTLEAEYTALSYALKALIPLKRMLLESAEHLSLPSEITSTIRARVFEDNQGAYLLATNHRITNRTRYFLNKWHWFWDHSGEFQMEKIDSKNQRADYCTKALTREPFEHNRFLVQGW